MVIDSERVIKFQRMTAETTKDANLTLHETICKDNWRNLAILSIKH